jgi:hypothetical protein
MWTPIDNPEEIAIVQDADAHPAIAHIFKVFRLEDVQRHIVQVARLRNHEDLKGFLASLKACREYLTELAITTFAPQDAIYKGAVLAIMDIETLFANASRIYEATDAQYKRERNQIQETIRRARHPYP